MQRITSLAACRELGGLAACTPGLCAWRKGPTWSREPVVYHRHWAGVCARPARPFSGKQGEHCWRLCRRKFLFAGQRHRSLCSQPGAEGPQKSSDSQPDVSVVGIPDPITWIRCRVIMYLINLYFELDVNSVEFTSGVKQALVHISDLMSSGRYHRLVGVVSAETRDYVEAKCKELTAAERKTLAVAEDEIVFVLPEDVSVVFDQFGRKFCFVVMRFWFLSAHEGPEDPEGARIFKVDAAEDEVPQKKIATAVYEFRRELTRGASDDWMVTTVWHWQWKAAENDLTR